MKIITMGEYRTYRKMCRKVKEGDVESIEKAARALSTMIPEGSTLIPIPGRFGYAAYTLMLTIRIAQKGGFKVENCLRGEVRDGLCEMKKAGKRPKEPVFRKKYRHEIRGNFVLIDNVYDTGMTAEAAMKALGKKCDIAVIGMTNTDKKAKKMEKTKTLKSESGRVQVDGKKQSGLTTVAAGKQSGRVPVDAEKQSGRVPVDGEKQSGRVPVDGEKQSGQSALERFVAAFNTGINIVNKGQITRPDDNERTTAQKYFHFYEPAIGRRLSYTTAGCRYDHSLWEAHIGNMAYYREPMDISLALHGPYRILDIRIIEYPTPGMPSKTEIWIDRFDFLTPLSPARLYKAEMIDALL